MTRRQRLTAAPGHGPTSQGGPEPEIALRAGEPPFLASQHSESGPGWEMHLGDCLEGLRSLADDSVGVVITDPPYDEHTHKCTRRGHTGYREPESCKRATFSRSQDLGFAPLTAEQMEQSAIQFARLARRWTLVFCSLEMIGDSAADNGHGWRAACERAGLEYVRTCIWHKVNSTPQFTGDRPSVAAEAIVLAHRPGRKRWNGGGKHGHYEHPIVIERGDGTVRLHTTQKPLTLMRELIADFTEPGELVLDAYAGSATTLLACSQLGRRSIGFERDHNYFDIACRRLRGDEAKPRPEQPSLLDWRMR